MKKNASNDVELIFIAKKRAKIVIEEKIKQLSDFSEDKYTINWIYRS